LLAGKGNHVFAFSTHHLGTQIAVSFGMEHAVLPNISVSEPSPKSARKASEPLRNAPRRRPSSIRINPNQKVASEVDRRPSTCSAQKSSAPRRRGSSQTKPVARAATSSAPLSSETADKLFRDAQQDKAAGFLASAQSKIKLALSYNSRNPKYLSLSRDLREQASWNLHSTDQAKRHRTKAREAEQDGNVDDAIRHLQHAISLSNDAMTYNQLGVLLATKIGDLSMAREMFQKAIMLEPNNPVHVEAQAKSLRHSVRLARKARPKHRRKSGLEMLHILFGKA
jgi:tetratricopeptide (TPR) repeat protein